MTLWSISVGEGRMLGTDACRVPLGGDLEMPEILVKMSATGLVVSGGAK